MTSTGAYDRDLPCKNPHCKSRGSPHPNCRCYPQFLAEGGEVSFNACAGPHQTTCEYHIPSPPSDADDVAASLAHGGFTGLLDSGDMSSHLRSIRGGYRGIDKTISAVFSGSSSQEAPDIKKRERVKEFIKAGGITKMLQDAQEPQRFAKGGEVKDLLQSDIAQHYPVQNVMLNASKGRIANYLNSLRQPENQPKLAFDDVVHNHDAERNYHQAIDVANNPLSVMHAIANGTAEHSQQAHLAAISPELTQMLQRKTLEKITEAQLKGEKPPFHVRQGLSTFLGAPLSGEMLPQNILAAQAVFGAAKPQQPQGQPAKAKSSSKSLTKSDQAFLTNPQALEKRQQRSE